MRIGVDGFGYSPSGGEPKKIPHVGLCVIGDDVEIGANSCVDRGSIGRTELGNQTKLDNLVHIGHNVSVGPQSVMAAMVGIGGSTSIGAGTMWVGSQGPWDHLEIGDETRVAAKRGLSTTYPRGARWPASRPGPSRTFFRANAAMYRVAKLRRRVRNMERALGLGRSREDAE